MPTTTAKIQPTAFKAAIGFLLALAILLTSARTCIRYRKFHRFFIDDGFLFTASIGLIVGTALTYVNIPYIYVQIDVEAGLEPPPANFIQQIILDQKTQDAATVFLWIAIFGVKFSFLFFFRGLIRRLKNLNIWWWCVLSLLVAGAPVCMCSSFISCSTFGPRVLEACVTPSALQRENTALKVTTVIDIVTDVILISIPASLLWRVRLSLTKKLALASVLCLSIFLIIISIIKVTAAKTADGQFDTTWGVFWLQAEASVAVIIVSVTVFRSIFVVDASRHSNEPVRSPRSNDDIWLKTPHSYLPKAPSATYSSAQTLRREHPDALLRLGSSNSKDNELPMEGPGIRVTRKISLQNVKSTRPGRPSYESFV